MTRTQRRLSHVADVSVSTVDKNTHVGESSVRLCNYVDVYKNEDITDDLEFMKATARDDEIAAFMLAPGDTVFTKDSETADDIGVPAFIRPTETPLVCGYHLAIARPKRNFVVPRYLFWALNADVSRQQWETLATGVTRVGLRQSEMGKVQIPIPPDLSEQQEIADFLDRETAKIDTLLAKQQRLISDLSERRTALLLRATMEPEHDWLQARVGHVLRKLERQPSDVAVIVTAYRDGRVTSRENRRDDGYTLSFTEKDYQRVHAGDLVFHALDGFAGAVGVSDSDGKCTPVYHVCEPLAGSNAGYLAFHLRALGQTGFLTAFAWSVRQRSVDYRNWTLFASLPICVPPSDRQSEIATKLAQEMAKIDRLVEKARELIAVMKERRTALISAAVTGQIDVAMYGKGG